MSNVKPMVEVKTACGRWCQPPGAGVVRPATRRRRAMRWLRETARKRSEKSRWVSVWLPNDGSGGEPWRRRQEA